MWQKIKMFLIWLFGILFGIITAYWNTYSYFVAMNRMYEKDSYHWEYDGKWLQPYGYIAIFLYFVLLFFIIFCMRKNKKNVLVFLIFTALSSVVTTLSLFHI